MRLALRGADLRKARMRGDNPWGAELDGADLSGASADHSTVLIGARQAGCRGFPPR
jgi:uncharacterized protein YjbI with pentapeptide repeats